GGTGNIGCADYIRMIEMTTRSAQKESSHRTVAFVNMPAFRARPACVARINGDDRNARQLRLILDESTQFGERPFRHLVSLSLPEPGPFANLGQVFQTDSALGVCGFLNDPFRDAMIFVRLKSAFFARKSFQFSLDVLWALAGTFRCCSLPAQRTSDFVLFLPNLLALGVGVYGAVAVGGEIHHAEIHADEILRWNRRSFRRVHGHEQKPFAVFSAYKVRLAFCQAEPFALVLAHQERKLNPPFQGQNRNPVNALERQDAVVVRHGGVGMKDRQNAFISTVSSSDVTNANRGHLSREVELFSQLVIVLLLKRDFVGRLRFEGLFGEPGAGLVKPLDGGFQFGGLFLIWQKLDLQSQFHRSALCRQMCSIASKLRNSSPSKSLRKAYAIVDGESLRGAVEEPAGAESAFAVKSVARPRKEDCVQLVCVGSANLRRPRVRIAAHGRAEDRMQARLASCGGADDQVQTASGYHRV